MKRCFQSIKVLFTAFFLLLSLSGIVFASSFGTVVSYGDSLSDNGYLDGYGLTRKTDGAIWVETLANSIGATMLFDFAFSGATTGFDNLAAVASGNAWAGQTGILSQISGWNPGLIPGTFPPLPGVDELDTSFGVDMSDTLFTLWGGANDFFNFRDAIDAADNIYAAMLGLAAANVQDLLVLNLPDLGKTPGFWDITGASDWTIDFNDQLSMNMGHFRDAYSNINLYFVDVFSLFSEEIGTTYPGHPDFDALFYDDVHPTSIGHGLIADAAANAIPEPTTMLLFGFGLLGLAGVSRRKK